MEYSVALVMQACDPQCDDCDGISFISFTYANHTDHAMLLKEWQQGELSEYNLPTSSELEFKEGSSPSGGCDVSIDGKGAN